MFDKKKCVMQDIDIEEEVELTEEQLRYVDGGVNVKNNPFGNKIINKDGERINIPTKSC